MPSVVALARCVSGLAVSASRCIAISEFASTLFFSQPGFFVALIGLLILPSCGMAPAARLRPQRPRLPNGRCSPPPSPLGDPRSPLGFGAQADGRSAPATRKKRTQLPSLGRFHRPRSPRSCGNHSDQRARDGVSCFHGGRLGDAQFRQITSTRASPIQCCFSGVPPHCRSFPGNTGCSRSDGEGSESRVPGL